MNWYEYAILAAANQLKPGDEGYATAQHWRAIIIARIVAREMGPRRGLNTAQ